METADFCKIQALWHCAGRGGLQITVQEPLCHWYCMLSFLAWQQHQATAHLAGMGRRWVLLICSIYNNMYIIYDIICAYLCKSLCQKKKEKRSSINTLQFVDVRSCKSTCSWSVVVEEREGGGRGEGVSWRGREVTDGCYENLLLFIFLCYTAIIKLNYCWYDVKHQTITQSVSGISSHSVWLRMELGNEALELKHLKHFHHILD